MRYEIQADFQLKIIADEEDRERLEEMLRERPVNWNNKPLTLPMAMVLGYPIGYGMNYKEVEKFLAEALNLIWVDPAAEGHLTDGAIYRHPTEGAVWWDESYQVRSFVDTLIATGEATIPYAYSE